MSLENRVKATAKNIEGYKILRFVRVAYRAIINKIN